VITLNAEGSLFVNDRAVTADGLKERLRAEPRASAVVVRADKTTLLERFVSLVDDVRRLGFQHVSLEVVRL
jgi:biopolymer transport protein ExbD